MSGEDASRKVREGGLEGGKGGRKGGGRGAGTTQSLQRSQHARSAAAAGHRENASTARGIQSSRPRIPRCHPLPNRISQTIPPSAYMGACYPLIWFPSRSNNVCEPAEVCNRTTVESTHSFEYSMKHIDKYRISRKCLETNRPS